MRHLVSMILLGLTAACAGQASGAARARGALEPLRADEIRRSGATDIHTAIRMLRPAFLQTRGRTSIMRAEQTEPAVYLDDRPLGGVAMLRDIMAIQVIEVRYLSATQAQQRWGGTGHTAGAILVITGSPR